MTDAAQLASPICCVDIYPFEGGHYQLQGGPIQKVTTSKSISGSTGSFTIELQPQPPNGVLSWTQIITPMSLCVIGMQRGQNIGVVMVGLVRNIEEVQSWQMGESSSRNLLVTGVDLAYYFTMLDFYTLWVLPLLGGPQGVGVTAAGMANGDPGTIARNLYEQIMVAGVFPNTKVQYQGSRIPFGTFMASKFELYDVIVPFGDYFLGIDGAWFNKFHAILPYPFYEMFVTTVQDPKTYGTSGGFGFASTGLTRSKTGTPTVIGRLNPLPQLVSSVGPGGTPSFDSIDTKKWVQLPMFDLGGDQFFMQSGIYFSEEEAFNFYTINPTLMTGQFGDNNTNINQSIYNFYGAVDLASMARYGFRPNQHNTSWIADMTGNIAVQGQANLPDLFATLVGRYAGFFEASPLMARAQVTTFLRPDIEIGCKLKYQPFNDSQDWLFYIDAVQHNWEFGGKAYTSLTLSRGLPSAVYSNSKLLFDIHTGNAERIDGVYKSGLPAGSPPGLHALSFAEYATWQLQIAQVYITPQQAAAHP